MDTNVVSSRQLDPGKTVLTTVYYTTDHCIHIMYPLRTLQHPGIWHKRNGGSGLHSGLAGLAGRSESFKTVHRVDVDCGAVERVLIHRRSHKEGKCET